MWLLLFAYQDVPYSHQLWWQFTLDADAPRGLRSLLGAAVLLVVVSLTWLLRTARPVIHLPTPDELERASTILMASAQPDGGLALTGDKALLFHPEDEAFLMYARRGLQPGGALRSDRSGPATGGNDLAVPRPVRHPSRAVPCSIKCARRTCRTTWTSA